MLLSLHTKTATHLVLLAVRKFCLFVVESTDIGTSLPSTDTGTYSTDTGTSSTDTETSTTVAEISIAAELPEDAELLEDNELTRGY